MSNALVGIDSVKSAQTICNGAISDLQNAASKLQQRYQQAGAEWKDKKYEQLGGIVNECVGAMKGPIPEMQNCMNTLREIERLLTEYLDTNL